MSSQRNTVELLFNSQPRAKLPVCSRRKFWIEWFDWDKKIDCEKSLIFDDSLIKIMTELYLFI